MAYDIRDQKSWYTFDTARFFGTIGGRGRQDEPRNAPTPASSLETMVDRLTDDHRRARRLAEALDRIDGLSVDLETIQTHLVLARLDDRFGDPELVAGRLRELGVGADGDARRIPASRRPPRHPR